MILVQSEQVDLSVLRLVVVGVVVMAAAVGKPILDSKPLIF
jgi:hypothetical protein